MQGAKINIKEIKVDNSFDMMKLVLSFIILSKGIKVSETELYAITYFVINGFNLVTRESLIESKLLKTKNCLANLVHRLRRKGFFTKTIYGEEINKDFMIPKDLDVIKLELLIKK